MKNTQSKGYWFKALNKDYVQYEKWCERNCKQYMDWFVEFTFREYTNVWFHNQEDAVHFSLSFDSEFMC